MRVTLRVPAGAILDEHPLMPLPGNVRQLMLIHERDPRIGRLGSVGNGIG
jgi:hypothetical protein